MSRSASPAMGGGMSTARLEALVDGVFAVAMTLLVLTLAVPHEPAGLSAAALSRHLLHDLLALRFTLLTYAISFVIAGVYWVGHHNQFAVIRHADRILLWITILFLLGVTCIPFSTALLGTYPRQPVALVIYGGNLIVIGLVLYLQWWYATGGNRLTEREIDPLLVRRAARRILIGPVLYLLAIVLAFAGPAGPALSLALYVLVPVLYIVPGRVDRHLSAVHREPPEAARAQPGTATGE